MTNIRWFLGGVFGLLFLLPLLLAEDPPPSTPAEQATPETGQGGTDPAGQDSDNHDDDGGDDSDGDPVDLSSGAFHFNLPVMSVEGRGLDFNLAFQYSNQAWQYRSTTGVRWEHNFNERFVARISDGGEINQNLELTRFCGQ